MAGFGHLGSLVDDINKRDGERLKLESQLRQQRMRADAEEAKVSQLKGELEVASADRVSLQQEIGLLSRRNEDLIAEKAKLSEQSSDFQRSMFNNEAKLKENERDLKEAQRGFVDSLEKSNASYSRHRAVMNNLVGRNGVGCAEIPSPEELEAFRGLAARAAELQARLHAVEAESQALKQEAAASSRKQKVLQREIDSFKIARLDDTCNRQMEYMSQLEEYANSVEAINEDLRKEVLGTRAAAH
ncbi:hypothetical protein Esi_0043_0005 [Ectocarpus siliculosus]|uniref:Uncharacterized protein n=1 Tax=Ectocarpus siliculosus TaxID=2880 RepID=D8LN29_ECTSI|nr:hypothetical protein Esi_0043_0005 [Ectocarpus siliculosus]|eukprot:CBN74792.1 hypothetical protein Esi_0043_0005 [Ectocarpus siliculosus]